MYTSHLISSGYEITFGVVRGARWRARNGGGGSRQRQDGVIKAPMDRRASRTVRGSGAFPQGVLPSEPLAKMEVQRRTSRRRWFPRRRWPACGKSRSNST